MFPRPFPRAILPPTLLVGLLVIAVVPLASCASASSQAQAQAQAPGQAIDWAAVSDVGVIEIVTEDDDGDLRETKVWFVLIDGVSYLRTSGSRWLENIRRDPNLTLRIGDAEYAQVARDVATPSMIERVGDASREKYGWQDAFIGAFRTSDPEILELSDPDS